MKRIICFCLSVMLACVMLTSCKNDSMNNEDTITLNFINNDVTKLIPKDYELKGDKEDVSALIEEVLYELSLFPEDRSYIPPLNQGFVVESFEVNEGKLVLNLSSQYSDLDRASEILTRASLVKTLTQLDGINYIQFKVGGLVLMDSTGNPIGVLSSDSFIDNESSQINQMAETSIKLYFANDEGNRLLGVTRTLTYNTNVSVEKLVVEQLIAGPSPELSEVYPTINPETGLLNVTVKDGICYVNFNNTFLTQPYNVTAETTIYSIVNSLIELPGVNKVQISIDGDSTITYKETISLTTPFERNLDMLFAAE